MRQRLSADDYLLYLRCPRSLHRRLAAPEPDSEHSGWRFPVEADRDEVVALARGGSYPAAPDFGHQLTVDHFEAVADVWHPQRPDGFAAVIVREASGVKRDYLVECAFIRYCAERAGERVARQYVRYLRKNYVYPGGEVVADDLLVSADVTRRVDRVYSEHAERLDELGSILEEDPQLERFADAQCARPGVCPECSRDQPAVGDDHVGNLFRGGELIRELITEGYESMADVPVRRLAGRRHRIQRRAVVEDLPQIDEGALDEFLGSLCYPVHYLDFEAVNSAVPHYSGTRPWEHVPYLFSLHTIAHAGAPAGHRSFLMDPHRDERLELVRVLMDAIGDTGSVVVYGAAFERGILMRLAQVFPAEAARITAAADRIVDLLQPFNYFSYYHRRQRGKVSLKTVFPVLTGADYSDLSIRDGYSANVAFRYLGTLPDSVESDLARDLVDYCTMDTLAMVRIVEQLQAVRALPGS